MDGLEAQYGGYFIKNIRKLAFFWKKNALLPLHPETSLNELVNGC